MSVKPQIKFSHKTYQKFRWGENVPTSAYLLSVHYLQSLHELKDEFLAFDTAYKEEHKLLHYALDMDKPHLLLLFFTVDAPIPCLFTTIRTWNAQKQAYYASHLKDNFKVTITGG